MLCLIMSKLIAKPDHDQLLKVYKDQLILLLHKPKSTLSVQV